MQNWERKAGTVNPTIAASKSRADSSDDTVPGTQPKHAADANNRSSPAPRECSGPGRNGEPVCGKPTDSRLSDLCVSHSLQQKKHGALRPLRTRTIKSTCVGPGQDGDICGRRVYSRPVGEDDGVCKTHNAQLKSRGFMSPIEVRLPPLLDICNGPGRDGSEFCGRPAEARDTLLCAPHARQLKNNGVLKPIRKVNQPDGSCVGPGPDDSLCGRSLANKTLGLCGGHYAQHRKGQTLLPIKPARKRGEVASCMFPGCRYNDAPSGEGYCHNHWRQLQNGQPLAALVWKNNRGKAVLDRDESGNKLCIGCHEWKPEAAFSNDSSSRDGLNYICRACQAAIRRNAKYGIDLDQYEALLAAQNGLCKLCRRPAVEGQNRLSVDHDHRCCPGEASCGNCIRGLLCSNCNQGLGLFREDADILMRGAHYVRSDGASIGDGMNEARERDGLPRVQPAQSIR